MLIGPARDRVVVLNAIKESTTSRLTEEVDTDSLEALNILLKSKTPVDPSTAQRGAKALIANAARSYSNTLVSELVSVAQEVSEEPNNPGQIITPPDPDISKSIAANPTLSAYRGFAKTALETAVWIGLKEVLFELAEKDGGFVKLLDLTPKSFSLMRTTEVSIEREPAHLYQTFVPGLSIGIRPYKSTSPDRVIFVLSQLHSARSSNN